MDPSGKITISGYGVSPRGQLASLRWLLGVVFLVVLCTLSIGDVISAWINNDSAIHATLCFLAPLSVGGDTLGQTRSLIPSNGSPCFDASPATAVNPYLRGVTLVGAGDLNGGQQALEENLETGFRLKLTSLWLGDLAALQGDLSRATEYWVRSEAGSVFLARAETSLTTKDTEDINLFLSVLRRLFDRLEPRQVRQMANLYQGLGDHFFEEKAYPDAASAYQAVLQCAPSRHHVRVRLAKIYRDQLDQPDEAIRELEQTIGLADGQWQPIAYGELGYTHFLRGQMEQALSALQRSIEIDQDLSMPHFYLGKLFQQEGQLALACEEYRTALALNPDSRWIENSYTQLCVSTK